MKKERTVVEERLWIERVDQFTVDVGFTKGAFDSFGGIEWLQLPSVGKTYSKDDVVVIVESNKVAVDVETPLSGTVVAVNTEFASFPKSFQKVSDDGVWLFTLRKI